MNQNHIIQPSLFDYDSLDSETRIVVQQRTEELRTMFRRTAEDIVQVGRKLDDVRNRLNNGNKFDAWLKAEFDMSRRTAYNFINVFERFGDVNLTQIDIATSALYALAAPSTTDEARQEALQRARTGEAISHTAARQIVDDHKPPRYCAACGEQLADDVQGKYCGGLHCKYQGTLRPDIQDAIEDDTLDSDQEPETEPVEMPTTQPPVARVVTVPSTQPPASPPPPPAPRPELKPAQPGKVVSAGKPAPAPLPPKPAPVMRPIETKPKATVISIRILPGEELNARAIMASIAEENEFPRTMESGTFAGMHDIVDRLCTAYFADELEPDESSETIEGQILATEPIS